MVDVSFVDDAVVAGETGGLLDDHAGVDRMVIVAR